MGFSKPEYWSELPLPFPGDLLDPVIEPGSLALQANSLLSEPAMFKIKKKKRKLTFLFKIYKVNKWVRKCK